jgi:PAS domain S-box-containing protein
VDDATASFGEARQDTSDELANTLRRVSGAQAVVVRITYPCLSEEEVSCDSVGNGCGAARENRSETVGSFGFDRTIAEGLVATIFPHGDQKSSRVRAQVVQRTLDQVACLDNIPPLRDTLLLGILEGRGLSSALLWQETSGALAGQQTNPSCGTTQVFCEVGLFFEHVSPLDEDLRLVLRNIVSQWMFRREYEVLREQNARLRERLSAFESSMQDPILFVGSDGIVLSANDAACRLLGYPAGGLTGLSLASVASSEALGKRSGGAGPRSEASQVLTLDARKRDGSLIRVECLLREVGERRGLVLTMRDSSDRVAVEDRLRHSDRLAMLGTLSRGLGHDINNMLFPIRAHLNALGTKVGISAQRRRQHLEEIRGSVGYLQHLADALHYLAQDSEDGSIEKTNTHLHQWWGQTGSLLSKALPRDVVFDVFIPEALPPVTVSSHGLSRAVLNLLINAKEALAQRQGFQKPTVELRVQHSTAQRKLVLSVRDNGKGMSEDVRRRAADMFFTTKPRGIGSGLGLPFVRAMAERVGGQFEIRSSPGRGTEIRLLLPVADEYELHVSRNVRIEGVAGRTRAFILPLFEDSGFEVTDTPSTQPSRARGPRPDSDEVEGTRATAVRSPTASLHAAWPWMEEEAHWPTFLVIGCDVATPEMIARWMTRRDAAQLLIVGPPAENVLEQCSRDGIHVVSDHNDIGALRCAVEKLISLERGGITCP